MLRGVVVVALMVRRGRNEVVYLGLVTLFGLRYRWLSGLVHIACNCRLVRE
jgi:hypothetical protein